MSPRRKTPYVDWSASSVSVRTEERGDNDDDDTGLYLHSPLWRNELQTILLDLMERVA